MQYHCFQIKNTKFSTTSNSPTHMQAAPSPTHMQTAPAHHISQKLKTYFGSSSLTSCTRLAPTKLRYRFSHGHTILLANQVQKAKCMVLSDVARSRDRLVTAVQISRQAKIKVTTAG